jgi:hypothetical protein
MEDDLMASSQFRHNQSQATLAKFKTENFCRCFQQCHKHWTCCIKSQWTYFKEDSMKQEVNAINKEKKYNLETVSSHLI